MRPCPEIDGLVGQETVGDVAMTHDGGRDDGTVLYPNAVVSLVSLLQSAENRDGVLDGGFIDEDGLESTFEGGIRFDVLSIFIERGGTDGMEFASGQGGFQKIARGYGAFAGACADDRVEFIDEEDDPAIAGD